ncbi:MAG: hypothetical protein H0X36_07975 [Sphingomonadaceae bacterium]|nr:hypothetical protein [Sphingomonadaceae bacterium]
MDATRDGVFGGDLSLRWSRPLRVTDGSLRLTGLGTLLDLAPEGREQDVEAVYARAFGPGMLTLNSYWRRQPGNFRAAPDDMGLALRYGFQF